MAMFDDPKKELKKLEEQLLKEEEWFDSELELAKALIGEETPKEPTPNATEQTQVFRQSAPAHAAEAARKVVLNHEPDIDLDEEEELRPRKRNRFLVILAVLETLGIVGVVAYWLLFLL